MKPDILETTLATERPCSCEAGGTRCCRLTVVPAEALCRPCAAENHAHGYVGAATVVQAHGLAHCVLATAAWLRATAFPPLWIAALEQHLADQPAPPPVPAVVSSLGVLPPCVCGHARGWHQERGCVGTVQHPPDYAALRCPCAAFMAA